MLPPLWGGSNTTSCPDIEDSEFATIGLGGQVPLYYQTVQKHKDIPGGGSAIYSQYFSPEPEPLLYMEVWRTPTLSSSSGGPPSPSDTPSRRDAPCAGGSSRKVGGRN